MNKKFKPILISITIFIVIIAVIPKLANPCAHTYCVGYWFEPCDTYDEQCEYCWLCELTCVYWAVHLVCWDEYGNQYWLGSCHDWFCNYWYPV